MSRPTLSKQDASPRAIALLEALHEPFSNEERLFIIEEALNHTMDYARGLCGQCDAEERERGV